MRSLLCISLFAASVVARADDGKKLYEQYCSLCHQVPDVHDLAAAPETMRLQEKMDFLRLGSKQKKLLKKYIRSQTE